MNFQPYMIFFKTWNNITFLQLAKNFIANAYFIYIISHFFLSF